MTSRTTPVGLLVVALAGLIAAGCTAQTSAVFDALVASSGTPVASVEAAAPAASPEAVDPGTGAVWWPHPDGYAMVLPVGWRGVALDEPQARQLLAALALTHPDLATRIQGVLAATGSRVIAIAGDPKLDGLSPILLVLAQPTLDRQAHAVKTLVKEQIAALPGLSAGPFRDDVTLPTAKGVQFDFSISDPDLGLLHVRSYLFRFGSDAYLVSFAALAQEFEAAEGLFEAIAASLRFGV